MDEAKPTLTEAGSTASLDEVLIAYERASPTCDVNVLQMFINEHPQHADALRRYAHVQLTFVPATAEEIERENDGPDYPDGSVEEGFAPGFEERCGEAPPTRMGEAFKQFVQDHAPVKPDPTKG